jgi:hypothetical protein
VGDSSVVAPVDGGGGILDFLRGEKGCKIAGFVKGDLEIVVGFELVCAKVGEGVESVSGSSLGIEIIDDLQIGAEAVEPLDFLRSGILSVVSLLVISEGSKFTVEVS